MCSYFLMLEIKSFVSLKNESCFFGRGYISREGSQILQHFEKWLLIKRGPGRFKFFFVGRGLGKNGWVQYFRAELIPWKTLWKGKTDTSFLSQTVVLNIKHATVNSIPYLGVRTVITLSHEYLSQMVQVELWTLAWKRWTAT